MIMLPELYQKHLKSQLSTALRKNERVFLTQRDAPGSAEVRRVFFRGFVTNLCNVVLSLADYIFLKILIAGVQSIKKVSLETLATVLPIPITFESRRKRIQRFLSLPNLSDAFTVAPTG
jgi:hypothetical protein